MASTQQQDLKCDYNNIRRLYEMEKLMKEQVDHTVDAENKEKLESDLTGIVKMKEDLWKYFNDSLKVTLEMNSIKAFRVEEALETPQEWDVMAILIQYLCPNTSDSAVAAAAAAEPDSASNARENTNRSAPEQKFSDKAWSWILDRGTTVGNFAAAVAELWLLTKVSEFVFKTTVPLSNTDTVTRTTDSSPKPKLPFATIVAQKGLQQILDAVKLDV